MKATNFNESMLPQINEVLKFVLENEHSDFYRKKYGENPEFYPVKSYEDFLKIPILEKDEILEVHWKDRLFVAESEVKRFAFSSGTTSKNKPFIIPRTEKSNPNSKKLEKIQSLGVKSLLSLRLPTSSLFLDEMLSEKEGTLIIPGNVFNMKLSARISKEIEIEGINAFPGLLDALIIELREIKFDFDKIKWISLSGEFCSIQKQEYYGEIFPNAYLDFSYGSAETGPDAYRCKHLAGQNPSVFHLMSNRVKEIVNEKGSPVKFGNDGFIIHTKLNSQSAFPFIRYQTRDVGRMEKEKCDCGEKVKMTISGKGGLDYLRVAGATLHIQAIKNSLKEYKDYLENKFQAHISEKSENGQIKPVLTLKLKLKNPHQNKAKDEMFLELLKSDISSNLRLTMQSNYEDFVEKGIFLPLKIELTEKWKNDGIKSKNIISHLE